jgi:hypothetical protein
MNDSATHHVADAPDVVHTPVSVLARLNWSEIAAELDREGYARLPRLLSAELARTVARQIDDVTLFRRASTDLFEKGHADVFLDGAHLPQPWATWCKAFYRELQPLANHWNERLGRTDRYPEAFDAFLERNIQAGQTHSLSHMTRLCIGEDLALHQCNDDGIVFPFQIVTLLSAPGIDFEGGEFVLVEQRPRMQSRPIVVPLALGDAAIITTAHRPFKGTRGDYRVSLRHAISRVHRGERIGVELSFHNTQG